MTTPAEQEAERRYVDEPDDIFETNVGWGKQLAREAFVAGWNECESRYRELLEAAREYRDMKENDSPMTEEQYIASMLRLLAAAAALEEEGAGV